MWEIGHLEFKAYTIARIIGEYFRFALDVLTLLCESFSHDVLILKKLAPG